MSEELKQEIVRFGEEVYLKSYLAKTIVKTKDYLDIINNAISKNDINHQGLHDEDILHIAVKHGLLHFVKVFIENGINVNHQNDDGMTPLMFSVIYQNYDIFKLLIDNGSDFNLKNNLGQTAEDLAKISSKKIYDEIIKKKQSFSSIKQNSELRENLLRIKIILGNAEFSSLVNDVLKYNNISLFDIDGWNLLHYAARYDLDSIAKLLLENGIDSKAVEFLGRTPLMIGISFNNVSVVKVLLEYDNSIDFDEVYDKTGILRNREEKYSDIIKLLEEAEIKRDRNLDEEFSKVLRW